MVGAKQVVPRQLYPVLQALLAALLFGASAPFAKVLLAKIEPIPLAGFLYLGAGLGLLAWKSLQFLETRHRDTEAALEKVDVKWLAGAILAGGIAAPIVLLFGLRSTPAATASLLLNFEGVATTLIAAFAFKEAVGRRAWWAIFVITLASILLSAEPDNEWGLSLGALGILGACVLWGIDNNLTLKISAKDPLIIVAIKGLAAGSCSLMLALILGNQVPDPVTVVKALALGGLSYGLSIVLFVRAMRQLGAARTSALFGTAPLAGMILSLIFLGDKFTPLLAVALALAVIGGLVLVSEEHSHSHLHEAAFHEHAHAHDDGHHDHGHIEEEPVAQAHSHPHDHSPVKHEHHHMPEIHHRHVHPPAK